MRDCCLLFALVIGGIGVPQLCGIQEEPKCKSTSQKGICICNWKYVNKPYTHVRNYFLTEEFWGKISKVCWGEIAQFECGDKKAEGKKALPGKGNREIKSEALDKALEEATKSSKLVFFIGLTGG
jgi:hypothetical protein